MTESEKKALQAKEKTEVVSNVEATKPGPIFTPAVDIFETDDALILLADLPGVKAKDLTIDLKEGVLALSTQMEVPEAPDEVGILREYETGNYYRKFNLSDVIDQSRIEAKLKDGVLRLTLPKVEAAAPRKIEVKAI
ncbi:MAG: Hsp20/alpha crystallin family protein [Deltaproteobacteria bacterium]|jgi:HSP20 family molecular chaperone IbpA|nr:Hsp20/alpha crystallin family protein [Deltaproteobacteria bacterium]